MSAEDGTEHGYMEEEAYTSLSTKLKADNSRSHVVAYGTAIPVVQASTVRALLYVAFRTGRPCLAVSLYLLQLVLLCRAPPFAE